MGRGSARASRVAACQDTAEATAPDVRSWRRPCRVYGLCAASPRAQPGSRQHPARPAGGLGFSPFCMCWEGTMSKTTLQMVEQFGAEVEAATDQASATRSWPELKR